VNALLELVIRRRRLVVAGFALAALAAAAGLPRLERDNSAAVYAERGTDRAARFERFVARFGRDQAVRIVIEGERLWSAAGLLELERLERAAAALDGVASSASLVRHHAADGPFPPADVEAFRARATANELDRALGWVGAGGRAASVLVELEPLAPPAYARLERELERLAATLAPGLAATVVGARSVERALDASALEVVARYFPLLVLFAVVLLATTFRDAGGVAVPLGFVAACEATTLGAMGWAGARFHLVLAVLPPLLFVIALATAVHLVIRCRALEAEGHDAVAATRATYRDKGRAVLWTGLSTAGGFAALAASPVGPVRDLAVWAAAGLGFQLLAAFTLLPALLAGTAGRRARLPERALEERLERLGRRWAEGAIRHRRAVLAGFAALSVAAAFGLARLGAESDVVRYFAPEHPTRVAIEHSEALGIGVSTLELMLEGAAGDFADPERLAALAALGDELATLDGVLSVASAADLLDDVGAASPWAALATAAELRGQALEIAAAEPALGAALARWLTADRATARVTLFVRTAGFETIDALAARAVGAARRRLPAVEVAATGTLPLVLGFHRSLITTLGVSLAMLAPGLWLLFLGLLGRPGAALAALAPNLGPVVLLLGGMGAFGIALDLATVMVASIVLGLAADDSIHTLARFRAESRARGARAAVVHRLERTAPAFLLTGAILIAGFGVCALSSFAPIARFGALAAVAIVLALVADLVLLPALFGGPPRRTASPLG
jgi:predicted RND superfamily exporter protein